jgi:hypothetical protein
VTYSLNIDSEVINVFLINLLNYNNIVSDIIFMFVLESEVPLLRKHTLRSDLAKF